MEAYPGIGSAIVMIPIFAVIGCLVVALRSLPQKPASAHVERRYQDLKEEMLWQNYVFAKEACARSINIWVPEGSGEHVYEERHRIVDDARRKMERARAEYDAYCAKGDLSLHESGVERDAD